MPHPDTTAQIQQHLAAKDIQTLRDLLIKTIDQCRVILARNNKTEIQSVKETINRMLETCMEYDLQCHFNLLKVDSYMALKEMKEALDYAKSTVKAIKNNLSIDPKIENKESIREVQTALIERIVIAYAEQGETNKATKLAAKIFEKTPTPTLANQLGCLLERRGDYDAAIKWYQQANCLTPHGKNEYATYRLEQINEKQHLSTMENHPLEQENLDPTKLERLTMA